MQSESEHLSREFILFSSDGWQSKGLAAVLDSDLSKVENLRNVLVSAGGTGEKARRALNQGLRREHYQPFGVLRSIGLDAPKLIRADRSVARAITSVDSSLRVERNQRVVTAFGDLRTVDPAHVQNPLTRWTECVPPDAGRGVQIAVVDTGVDLRHPDLSHVRTTEASGLDDAGSHGLPHPHATHIAGIIGARGSGFRAVAPKAELISVRVTKWGEHYSSLFLLGQGITSVARDFDVHLINVSMAWDYPSNSLNKAVLDAYHNGAVCVAAAGNNARSSLSFPAACKHMIAVSAFADSSTIAAGTTDRNHIGPIVSNLHPKLSLARFSNHGAGIDFMAPGVGMLSCLANAGYAVSNGTSQAAASIVGLAAAVLARDHANVLNLPKGPLRSAEITKILVSRGKDLGFEPTVQGSGILHA